MSAAEQQHTFYNQFGDRLWDSIPRIDDDTLKTKISFTLYSIPYDICTAAQKDSINATERKLLELCGSGDVHFGCVFVNVLPKETREPCIFPLIRTKQTYGDDIYFIETQPGRVYTGWTDFLENNKIPSSHICYPAKGFYQSRYNQRVNIEFQEISGTSVVSVILDITSAVVKIGSTALIGASVFFPLATPLMLAAGAALGTSTAYSTTCGIIELVDRGAHHESIDLTDERARSIWIGMGVDVIGSVLIGGAVALPRLVASGRLASSMASSIMDVLNWVSVGVNSFGVLANVAVLIAKFRSGTIEFADIAYFISSCLFIGNIVVNAVVAEKVIQSLSKQPSQVGSIFKMIANTSFNAIKTISAAVTLEAVIETICGETVVAFMRYFGLQRVAQTLQTIKGLLRRYRRGPVNIWTLLLDLQRLLSCHLKQVLEEVSEAWKNTRAFFIGFNFPGNLFTRPSVEAAEIVNNAERVLDNADIHDEVERNCSRDAIIRASLQISINMNAQTEREFANLCQMAMNDIRRRCDQRMVLAASQQGNHLFSEDRRRILQEAIQEFRHEFEADAESFEMNENQLQNSNLPLLPLTSYQDFDMHVFQVQYRVPQFDQFIYDAACRLLNDDDFLDQCRIHSGEGPVIIIQSSGNTLIFYYDKLKNTDTAIGLVLLKQNKVSTF